MGLNVTQKLIRSHLTEGEMLPGRPDALTDVQRAARFFNLQKNAFEAHLL